MCPHPGCGKKFYLSNHLRRHMIIHSGQAQGHRTGAGRVQPRQGCPSQSLLLILHMGWCEMVEVQCLTWCPPSWCSVSWSRTSYSDTDCYSHVELGMSWLSLPQLGPLASPLLQGSLMQEQFWG